jgi:hypothetical protein
MFPPNFLWQHCFLSHTLFATTAHCNFWFAPIFKRFMQILIHLFGLGYNGSSETLRIHVRITPSPWMYTYVRMYYHIALYIHTIYIYIKYQRTVKSLSIFFVSQVSPSYDHTQTHHTQYYFSGLVISPSQRPVPDNTQYTQQTNIHAPGGIRTHDRSRQAAVDLRRRPRGHWERLPSSY